MDSESVVMQETLPSPRNIISSLFAQLPKQEQESDLANIDTTVNFKVKDLSSRHKQLFLTLHCLFPNEFLPALDLLDRSLVTRFVLKHDDGSHTDLQTELNEKGRDAVYYVQSAQPSKTSRHQYSYTLPPPRPGAGLSYQVRLRAWNCSCPAFTFSAFSHAPIEKDSRDRALYEGGDGGSRHEQGWSFGGQTLGDDAVPICKHLLACVMIERCELLSGFVHQRVIGKDEVAGWAAGWGDCI